ncbi:MAG: alpha/beta hydrolase, partial [Pseudomonadales bacterium]|nr:alpha/beta hydrolase [Pseudomonadales bacterium]
MQVKPDWFQRALDAPSENGSVDVEGCTIRYAVWGEPGRPGIVLVHGSNAHLEWWRFVAPFLADQFRVAALSLSGNGDSGWREKYSGEVFAREVMAVAEHAGLGENPFVVAHSFGGFVALETGHHFGDRLGGIVFCDFTVAPPEQYVEWGLEFEKRGPARPTRVYDDLGTALGRFRLVPEQPCQHPYIIEYLARQSLREVEGGWTWKFDPSLFDHLEMGRAQRDKFVTLACWRAVVLGEHSTDGGAQDGEYLAEISGGLLPIFTIPGTYHHFMFDEPMATVAAIKGILLAWRADDHKAELASRLAAAASPAGG